MTLKVRNHLMQLFFIISILLITFTAIAFIVALVKKAILPPPALRLPGFVNNLTFLKYSFTATMISICIIVIYSPVAVAHVLPLFETTQTTEIIFFLGFLSGCLCEVVRFLTPLFGLWSTFSELLFFCGRLLFTGRLLCPLSFVFAAIASSVEVRQDVERNMAIMYMLCIVFALIVPLNTARVSSTGTITWGFPELFFIARLFFVAIAFISFWINSIKQNVAEYKKAALSMLVVMSGYGILICADNYVFMILGTALLAAGTSFYLQTLHLLYMWK